MTETGKRAKNATISDLGIKNAIVHWNLDPDKLAEIAIKNGQAKLTSNGAININTGEFTGRSPMDRFIVRDAITEKKVWWGDINQAFNEQKFDILHQKILNYLSNKEIYVRDAFACADKNYRMKIRVVNEFSWSNMFAYNMFLRPNDNEIKNFKADWTILNAPGFMADGSVDGTRQHNFAIINFTKQIILIGGTGYTGEIGFELYVKNSYLIDLWKLLFKTKIQLKPIGLAARDTLRLEKGFCLYGNEINDTTSPIEAGLTWVTKFNKNFIGKDIIQKVLKEGPTKKLVGIELLDKGIARKDHKVFSTTNQKEIGFVTSGTMSPTLNKPIALAFINVEYTNVNSIVEISIRNKKIKSKVVNLPFI